jgi:hypothetical protein
MKILPKIKGSIVVGATLLTIVSISGIAFAQEVQRTYTVINPQIEVKLNPGGRSEGTTELVNDTNAPLTFNLTVRDYVVNDTNGTPTFLPAGTFNNKYSAASWIAIDPGTITLTPHQVQKINYYIQVPANARPGGHYAGIVYAPATKTEQKTGGIINTQIGSLFYVTVNGPITENSIVSKFFANSFQEYGPVKVLTQIENLGDLHITPKASITVSGLFFNSTQNLPTHNIFPETTRDFQNSIGQTFMIGRYKATLMGSYGVNNNMPLVAGIYFWVFPWKLALVIVLIIVAIVLAVLYLRKRKKNGPTEPTRAEDEPVVTPPPATK